MANTSDIEGVAGAIQFISVQVAKYVGGVPAQAVAAFLAGEMSVTATMTDLLVKIQKGEAIPEDLSEVFAKTASTLAGLGVMLQVANPGSLAVTGAASGALFLYEKFVPEEKKQEFWDGVFNLLVENSFAYSIGAGIKTIDDAVTTQFSQSRTWTFIDPLALDLDGDGIETAGINASMHVLFDHNGDGIKTGSGWLKGDDAWLVLDKNGNGRVDNGNELFGVDTLMSNGRKAANGFAALADLDGNHDGVFNALDTKFVQVQVWRDLNQNGVSDAGELKSLIDTSITGINLNCTTGTTRFADGNAQSATGTYIRTDGSAGKVANLDLTMNGFYREFGSKIALTAEAAKLPALRGAGMVRDLREAATIDPKLIDDINSFRGMSRGEMMDRLDQFLQAWADTSEFKTSKQQIGDMGMTLLFQPTGVSNAEMRSIELGGQLASVDSSGSLMSSMAISDARYEAALTKVTEMGRIIGVLEAFNGQTFINIPDDRSLMMASGSGVSIVSPTLTGFNAVSLGADGFASHVNDGTAAIATQGSEIFVVVPLLWINQTDPLYKGYVALRESVYGSLVPETRLKDYIDAVNLKFDANRVSFNFGDLDTTLDRAYRTDPLRAFIDCLDLQKYCTGLSRSGWQGAAKLASWAVDISANGQLELLNAELAKAFAKSSSVPAIKVGTPSAETMFDSSTNDILVGLAGNDFVNGGGGNDILDGGAGNDGISGGAGDDVYLFGRGGGQDSINNYDTGSGKTDAIEFASDISPDELSVTRTESNLVLSIVGTSDKLTVSRYFDLDGAGDSKLEEIRFGDGAVWTIDTVKEIVQRPTVGNDFLYGYAINDRLDGGDGNDTIYGKDGDDRLNGDAGRDFLYGGIGTDVLFGGVGDDLVEGGEGGDQLVGQEGNDVLRGDRGDDTIVGGVGNDFLSGDGGSDIYFFSRGDGRDRINNYDTSIGKIDAVQFATDIDSTDVTVVRSVDDLVMSIAATSDSLTITNYFEIDASSSYKLEEIRFGSGAVWTIDMVKTMVQQATSGNDVLYGYTVDDVLSGGGGDDKLYGKNGDDRLNGDAGRDFLYGGIGSDVLFGGAGDDLVEGGEGGDQLVGQEGNDVLRGDRGDDTIVGGVGNDFLSGDGGSDIYSFAPGDGQDRINNYDYSIGKTDVIQFSADIASTSVVISRSGSDLVLKITGSSDQLTIYSYFDSDAASSYKLEEIRFFDGTVWTIDTVKTIVQQATVGNDVLLGYAINDVLSGGDGSDTIYGRDGDDVLYGDAAVDILYGDKGADRLNGGDGDDVLNGGIGNDWLIGQEGNDSLRGDEGIDFMQGGAGNDFLYDFSGVSLFDGGVGNDTLTGGSAGEVYIGGSGNDILDTGAGNDLILFNKGDGQDTFVFGGTGSDTLSLGGSGLSFDDLSLSRSGDDLQLSLGANDRITFKYWYSATSAKPISQLQVITETEHGFTQDSADPLQHQTIESFNFKGLVDAFDQARAANPGLASWGLSNTLGAFQTGGSDTLALGGEIAFQYGMKGSVDLIGTSTIVDTMAYVGFGIQPQLFSL